MAAEYDAIIIGAGHNGLVCGSYLAKSGLKVLALERRHVIGGAAVTEEFSPGFRTSVFSYVMSLLHPRVIADLELHKFGLEVLPANDLFCPLYGDDYIIFSDDVKKTQAQFARFSKHDAEIYPAFDAYLQEATAIVRKLLFETPFDPTEARLEDVQGRGVLSLALSQGRQQGLSHRRSPDPERLRLSLGVVRERHHQGDPRLLRLDRHFRRAEVARLRLRHHAPHHGRAFRRRRLGLHPRRHGQHHPGNRRLRPALRPGGSDRRGGAEVKVTNGRATGVRLLDGREFSAKAVISNASAKMLFQKLVSPSLLPAEFNADIERFRTFSTAFKMNVAADAPPRYRAFDKAKAGFDYPTYVHVGPDIDYLERAYDDAKYGWYSSKPFVTPVVPTIVDDTLAPKGKHVINMFGGHAPYRLKNGDWAHERENFVKNVMGVMNEFAPGFSDQVIDMQVLLPPDIEEIVALPQGHIFHGELSPDQLFFQRPAPHYADYRTPIGALYQCGSSVHPGGGVSGIPGFNAAREILKDWPALKRLSS